jgi:hypothetical protein
MQAGLVQMEADFIPMKAETFSIFPDPAQNLP